MGRVNTSKVIATTVVGLAITTLAALGFTHFTNGFALSSWNAVSESAPLTNDQQALVDFAVGRFEAQGLELPTLSFEFYPSSISCEGRMGLYWRDSHAVRMCSLDKHTMLHELAHAWANLNLTEAQMSAFAAYRGLEAWNDQSHAWKERATEQAAEIIAWGLTDEPEHVRFVSTAADGTEHVEFRLLTIDDSQVGTLHDAFVKLVGAEPMFRYPMDWDSEALEADWQSHTATIDSPEARRGQ